MRRMTKLISSLLAVCLVMSSVSALAAEIDYDREAGADVISLDGEAGKNEIVFVQVLPENITPADIQANPDKGANAVFVKSAKTDAEGLVNFEFALSESGNYVIYMGTASGETAKAEFSFVPAELHLSAVALLKAAVGDFDVFKQVLGENKADLGFDIDLYSDEAVEVYYDEFKNAISDDDFEQNVTDFTKAALLVALNNEEDINAADYIRKVYKDDETFIGFMDKHMTTVKSEEYFTEKLSGVNIKKVEGNNSLYEKAVEALVLTAVRYPDGNNNIKLIMDEYKDILDLDSVSNKSSVYTKVAGKEYDSISAFLSAYKNAGKDDGGSGTGSGFGGGKTPSNNTDYVTGVDVSLNITNAENKENTTLNIKFEDLDSVEWAYKDISELYDKGIINGVTETSFKPERSVKREEFIKMIVCAMGLENMYAESCGFDDVDQDAWYAVYVNIAKKFGITNGVGDNMFGTGREITRQDMTVMIFNAMKLNGYKAVGGVNAFNDKDACASYAVAPIGELSHLGIVTGVGENTFNPMGIATRAEAAVIINRALKYLE